MAKELLTVDVRR